MALICKLSRTSSPFLKPPSATRPRHILLCRVPTNGALTTGRRTRTRQIRHLPPRLPPSLPWGQTIVTHRVHTSCGPLNLALGARRSRQLGDRAHPVQHVGNHSSVATRTRVRSPRIAFLHKRRPVHDLPQAKVNLLQHLLQPDTPEAPARPPSQRQALQPMTAKRDRRHLPPRCEQAIARRPLQPAVPPPRHQQLHTPIRTRGQLRAPSTNAITD